MIVVGRVDVFGYPTYTLYKEKTMNGRIAKTLWRAARQIGNPDLGYIHTGTKIVIGGSPTRRWHPKSVRGVYKQLKKVYNDKAHTVSV
jgi:hypothetical protein